MPKYNSQITSEIVFKSVCLKDDMEKYARSPGDINIQIKSLKVESCFRIRFKLPVLLHFHPSTRSLNKIHWYRKNLLHTFPIGFIPTYNCNLNHLTLLRTYGGTSKWFEQYRTNMDEEYLCKLFDNSKGESMEQSSLNFLLENNSSSRSVNKNISGLVNKCFINHCWNPPLSNYEHPDSHDFIYHNNSKIQDVKSVYKTIVKVVDVNKKRRKKNKENYVDASAHIMYQDAKKLFFSDSPIHLLILEPSASQIYPDDLFSCIISKSTSEKSPFVVNGMIKKINNFDLSQLISSTIWKSQTEISEQSSICKVDSVEQIRKKTLLLIENNTEIFNDDWQKCFDRKWNNSIAELQPMIFNHDNIIYHIPPPLVSYILCRELPILNNNQALFDFLSLVNTIDPSKLFGNSLARGLPEAEKVQLGPCASKWKHIGKEIPRVVNRIVYSRILSKPDIV